MPIHVSTKIRRLDQPEFRRIAYELMGQAFRVHGELGRFFEEEAYRKELAFRLSDSQMEVPIEVSFEDFRKWYYLDLVVAGSAIFELKAVESLAPRHRGQLLNYLLLTDTAHGKLINFRTERVQHEFVNATLTHAQRIRFAVEDGGWEELDGVSLRERMIAVLRDWGTALDLALYEEVAAHFCGRKDCPYGDVEICVAGRRLGVQPIRLAAPGIGLRISAVSPDDLLSFEAHLRRLLEHTDLRAIQWINTTPQVVRFATIAEKEMKERMLKDAS